MIDPQGKFKRLFPPVDKWSDTQPEIPPGIQVGAAANTLAMPDVILTGIPPGATIILAYAMFKFRIVENSNVAATNALDGATVPGVSQVIRARIAAGAWIDAINLVDNQYSLAISTREGGDIIIGSINIAAIIANATFNFRWLLSKADVDFLNFNEVQTGIRFWYYV